MNNEQLVVAIMAILTAGSGVAIQFVLTQYLKWKAEDNQEVSPKTKRRLAILFCLAIPSGLYLLAVWLSDAIQYEFAYHATYVLGAFMSQQLIHGETKLPNGEQVEQAKIDVMMGDRP